MNDYERGMTLNAIKQVWTDAIDDWTYSITIQSKRRDVGYADVSMELMNDVMNGFDEIQATYILCVCVNVDDPYKRPHIHGVIHTTQPYSDVVENLAYKYDYTLRHFTNDTPTDKKEEWMQYVLGHAIKGLTRMGGND